MNLPELGWHVYAAVALGLCCAGAGLIVLVARGAARRRRAAEKQKRSRAAGRIAFLLVGLALLACALVAVAAYGLNAGWIDLQTLIPPGLAGALTPEQSVTETTAAPTPPPAETKVRATPTPHSLATAPALVGGITPEPGATSGIESIPPGPLSESGPWRVFVGDDGVWAANPDGSGLTLLDSQLPVGWYNIEQAVSPAGGHVAFVTADDPDHLRGLTLRVYTLPAAEQNLALPLTNPATEAAPDAEPGDPAREIAMALMTDSLAWSPDGARLAFIGAMDGPSADLYLYSIEDGSITRLSTGPSQGYQPRWSPDGLNIVHMGVTSFGTGAGFAMAGAWAAPADGSEVTTLYSPDENSGGEEAVGWFGDDAFVVYTWDAVCGRRDLRAVNLVTLEQTPLWPDYFTSAAVDLLSQTALVLADSIAAGCNPDGLAGLYFIPPGGEPQLSARVELADVKWGLGAGAFVAYGPDGLFLTDSEGQSTMLMSNALTEPPAVASDGVTWVWSSEDTLYLEAEGETQVIYPAPASNLAWSPEGEWLHFTSGGLLLVAQAPDFVPRLAAAEDVQQAAWVWP